MNNNERGSFSSKLGFVLSAAGASVGLGNIWRFPYLAARYGGGAFLLVYIILAMTFGYTMLIAETSIGRSCRKGPVGAFNYYGKNKAMKAGGWLNAIIPVLIVPYYSVIGGWVCKYLYEFIRGNMDGIISDSFFTDFISSGWKPEFWFIVFSLMVLAVIWLGVNNGIERVSKLVMPLLVVLAVVISVYTVTRPGAMAGVKYLLVPDFSHFSWMTVVSAMGQMFYSLSIAMGILITFGSYMKKDTGIDRSAIQVEIFDTAIAILGAMMIIPAVFAYFGGSPETLNQGPALMFITMPRIFAGMGFGRLIGILFFVLVLFAALTSAIALCESAVSTFSDEFHMSRRMGTVLTAVLILVLGTLSCLGYGPLAMVKIFGMAFLDFFDFLTNSLMMPAAAVFICLLVTRHMGIETVAEEVMYDGQPFGRRKIFNFMIRYICPVFAVIILLSSLASALGWISF